ncbi:tetratricopeptide repeat protein [Nioella nitratireducens]|uniref:tetratricopeptide repeat protein n=1 Tax=Nioella nitratireducens TaxID=1287720 RepID=UPI000A05D6BD|nr:tetratricopeptide repeat protein [Nioella nitratireducens]
MRMLSRFTLILGLCLGAPAVSQTTVPLDQPGLAGAYLAARSAAISGDHREAARQFERLLQADPDNVRLIGDAMLAFAAIGDWDSAGSYTDRVPDDADERDFANLVDQVNRVRAGDLAGAAEAAVAQSGAGPLIDPLLEAWLYLAEGDMSRASQTFEAMIDDNSPLAGLVPYQLGLARASVGDFEGAMAIFSGEVYGPLQLSSRGIQAHAQVLVQLDRADDALALLDQALVRDADQSLIELRAQIAADPTRPYDFIVTPEQGMAEVFFSLARVLGSDAGTTLPLVYARAAHAIDPGHIQSLLLAGNILSDARQYQMAVEVYGLVPRESPLFVEAEQGRSEALFQLDRQEAAVEVLQSLARDYPDLASVHTALGDVLRRQEQFDDAIAAYTAAIGLIDTDQSRYWFLFYARAISYERTGQWDAAEADFRHALELEPDQPNVLNYLGYSLIEQGRDLDEALDMIQRAVAARPDNGYIVDSLGWVYFQLGRYEDAVAPMERALALTPNDPILNDHLGDVYWMVGRTREAEFQWSRALSFDPDPADADRIRLKLDIGLDAVLEQEQGQPVE